MRIRKEDMLLYAVTDRTWLSNETLAEQVEKVLKGGATLLQLREKEMPYDLMVEDARELKIIADQYKIPFIINDRIDVAAAVDAAGVHLGQDDDKLPRAREILGADKIIGISAHSVEEALVAQKNGADYIGVGAVYGSSTKKDTSVMSYETLSDICRAVAIPVVAIGGITRHNIMGLTGSGVDGVAVISAVFASPDITAATEEMLELSKTMIGRLRG